METTKTVTRTFAVLDKTFEHMGEMSYFTRDKGEELRLGGPGQWYLADDGTLRHKNGVFAPIPKDHFHLEVEEEVHVVTVTRRRA